MRLSSLLVTAVTTSMMLVAGLGALTIVAHSRLDNATLTQNHSSAIIQEISSQFILLLEFSLYEESRAITQWKARQNKISELLDQISNLDFKTIATIKSHHQLIDALFQQLTEIGKQKQDFITQRRKQLLLDQLLSHSQVMMDDVYQWHEFSKTQQAFIESRFHTYAIVAPLIIFLILFSLVILMMRRVIQPLKKFQHAVDTIARGDLSARASTGTKDELGQLSEAFDTMAIDMVNQLNREIDERKNTAKALAEYQLQLEEKVKSRTRDLNEAKKAAESANIAKSRFLANMSHELRTPMHAILNFTALALKRESDKKNVHFLENIKSSSTRLTGLLNDLLDLSKLESGKMEADFSSQNLIAIFNQAIEELRSILNEKGISIDFDQSQKVEQVVDGKLMTQVIINLLSNAIKFSPSQGVITIKIDHFELKDSDKVKPAFMYSIIDQGIGVPSDQLEEIFDQFSQSTLTRSQAGGTGLGLPISREIIELHQGRIWAESPPRNKNIGTQINFIIPLLPGSHKDL